MPTPLTTVPDPLARGPFTAADAARHGLGRGALRHPRFVQPFAGVYQLAELPASPLLAARGALLALPSDAVLCRATAAQLRGWPLPARRPSQREQAVHVVVADSARVPHVRGVVAHEGLRDGDRELVVVDPRLPPLPLTSPAATFRDLGLHWRLDDLVALADRLLWRREPLCTREDLARAVEQHAGRRGVVRLRAALSLACDGAQSPRETALRLLLLRAGLPQPLCNVDLLGPAGWLARPDLHWPRWRVIAEYDGEGHRDADRHQADEDRRWRLDRAGWRVVVVTERLWRTPAVVVARVTEALVARGWRPGTPLEPADHGLVHPSAA